MEQISTKIRKISQEDFYLGYFDLIKQLGKYECQISYFDFCKYLELHPNYNIFVLVDISTNKLIGCGSFFVLNKIHTNPIGQIEDVVIDKNFRGMGFGKKIIDYLVNYGLNNTNCYKIVLNCNLQNLAFYEKCGFCKVGNQCKFIQ